MKLQDFDFRLWSKEAKIYFEPKVEFERGKVRLIPENDDRIEIELWTGFCGKNNKKIFENDIVKHLDTNLEYLVEFHNASFIMSPLKYQHRREFQLSISIFFSTISKEAVNNKFNFLEIIGNIHENKNLLKKDKQ